MLWIYFRFRRALRTWPGSLTADAIGTKEIVMNYNLTTAARRGRRHILSQRLG
jgi:hypothetical protein